MRVQVTSFNDSSVREVESMGQPDSYFGCWALCTTGCSAACIAGGGLGFVLGLGAAMLLGDAATSGSDYSGED